MSQGLRVRIYQSEFGFYATADDENHGRGDSWGSALQDWHKKHGGSYRLQVPAKEIVVTLPVEEQAHE